MARASTDHTAQEATPSAPQSVTPDAAPLSAGTGVVNEISDLPQEAWFIETSAQHNPILVAEASDSAFATRLRQVLSQRQLEFHLPRTSFPTDETLEKFGRAPLSWPDVARAKLLADAAVRCLGRCYHIVRPSALHAELDEGRYPAETADVMHRCRHLAVFAIGELYMTRISVSEATFPGLSYFAHAIKLAQTMPERPSLIMVETQLLLSWYALLLNRRHSAYSLAGTAIRLAVIVGLHLPTPSTLLGDHCLREQRKRVFWTAYVFDRMWAAKLGYPVSISDLEIEVDLPMDITEGVGAMDFRDSDYFRARIGLATLCGRLTQSIYSRRPQNREVALYQRVQQAFFELRQWMQDLPSSLQVDGALSDPRAVSLQLLFNQVRTVSHRYLSSFVY